MLHLGTIQLKGWKQVIGGLVALLAILWIYTGVLQSGLNDILPVVLKERIKSDMEQEIARQTLPIAQGTKPTREHGERYLEARKQIEKLRIISVDKRGWGASIVAKVRFSVGDGAAQTRFYRLKHNWLTRWNVWSSVTERAWQTGWL